MDTIKMAKISGIFWKKENVEDEISKLYCIIGCIVFVGIILFILIHNQYTSKQKQKDLVIIEKELELEYLKKKLNTAFEEVLQLAKDDDVSFLTRFNEVYPEFSKKLSLKYPDLTSNDIKFCALLKLNFSNKEIAQYGHLSIRTVESKKYRLRKKLKLTSDVDLNKWMMRQ
ncbi:helix-turn-helix transcriptional regulator [Chryseobacterium daecheongense]|nr:LuxR C-terminal-related transcriptional regulator [Chryseobacterium daecheongense]